MRVITLIMLVFATTALPACTNVQESLFEVPRPREEQAITSPNITAFLVTPSLDSVQFEWKGTALDRISGFVIRRSNTSGYVATDVFDTNSQEVVNSKSAITANKNLSQNTEYTFNGFYKLPGSTEWTYYTSSTVQTQTPQKAMISLVSSISDYSRSLIPNFIVLPLGGHALMGEASFRNKISGIVLPSHYFGPTENATTTSSAAVEAFVDPYEADKPALVLDYIGLSGTANAQQSHNQAQAKNYISFQRPSTMNSIPEFTKPPIKPQNNSLILTVNDANNFVFVNKPLSNALLTELKQSDFDIVIVDIFTQSRSNLSNIIASHLPALKQKHNGGSGGQRRLVLAYVDIAHAYKDSFYWLPAWNSTAPSWLENEVVTGQGKYRVKYWEGDWQNVVYGNDNSYIKQVINAGFDGVVLDSINNYIHY